MAVWFTADTHFGHANIIRHCQRPFAGVEEMDAHLLDRINERVGVDDILYHLGDFAILKRGADVAAYRSRIRCRRVVLVLGNHDPQTLSGQVRPEFAGLFHEVHSLLRIKVPVKGEPQLIVLCHYALRVWDRSHHGVWHLFGHSHGGLADDPHARSWDVGVDCNGYAPMSLDEVAAVMARKTFRPVDHHREE
jgi:calcineurin-like phosphoesterase family protein